MKTNNIGTDPDRYSPIVPQNLSLTFQVKNYCNIMPGNTSPVHPIGNFLFRNNTKRLFHKSIQSSNLLHQLTILSIEFLGFTA